MNDEQKVLIEAKTEVLKALAHPTRLYIIEELARGEQCVCKFVEAIKADFSTVSKHLAVLKNAGLVDIEKRGQLVFYQLRMQCLPAFLNCIGKEVAENSAARSRIINRQHRHNKIKEPMEA
ncbi:MAG: transcriptional regulator [Candidatus Riflebacteria bacterium HGW-Riflebacteria-1]|jgi:ArsR family transcriptional regulator|nr:MAG: transcriptional regulator [Candidatus Riflebacteria bacterium HGW-Riflebacteria-1]